MLAPRDIKFYKSAFDLVKQKDGSFVGTPKKNALEKTKEKAKVIEKSLQEEGSLKGMNFAQKKQMGKKVLDDAAATEIKIKEYNKKDPNRKQKMEIHKSIKPLEKSKNIRSDVVSDIRKLVFGDKEYKVSRDITADQMKEYLKRLQRAEKTTKDSKEMKKIVTRHLFPEDKASVFAKALGKKDGDYTKLKGAEKEIFLDVVQDYSRTMQRGESNPMDNIVSGGKNELYIIKDGIKSKALRSTFAGWTALERIVSKSSGRPKTEMAKIQQFLLSYPVVLNPIKNNLNKGLKELRALAKNKVRYAGMKNFGYWANPVIYNKLKEGAKDKSLSPKVREAYKEKIAEVEQLYKESNNPGSPAHQVKMKFNELMGYAKSEMRSAVESANKGIEGTKAYKEVMNAFDAMIIKKDYVPQIFTEKAKDNISQERTTVNKIGDLAAKAVKRKAKELINKRFPKDKRKGDAYNKALEKEINRITNSNEAEHIRDKAETDYVHSLRNGEFNVKSKHFMRRGETADLFFEGIETTRFRKKEKMFETYEPSLDNMMASYIESVPKLITTIKLAPDMVSKFKNGEGFVADPKAQRGGVEGAFKFLEKFSGGKESVIYNYVNNIKKDITGEYGYKGSEVLKNIATTINVGGLSALAEPGIKNATMGQLANFATRPASDLGRTFKLILNPNNRFKNWRDAKERAERVGAIELLEKDLLAQSGKPTGKALRAGQNVVFKVWSLMKPFETFNRISSIEQGRHQYLDVVNVLTNPTMDARAKRQGRDYLKDELRFTDKEIKDIESGYILESGKASRERYDF